MHHNPISVTNLSYAYGDGTQALREINIEIKATERVALIGANGSGKSTLLRHLNGILPTQQGRIVVGEQAIAPETLTQIRNFVGIVFQNPDDQLFMPTVWEDIAFGPLNQGIVEPVLTDRIKQSMAAVGLDFDHYAERAASNLSGGEKKRVAIAGVLAMQPQVLVLDEPSAQLDPASRRQLIELLQRLPLTQLIATHDLDMVLELCSSTIVLGQGSVVFSGPTEQVLNNPEFLRQHSLEPPLCYARPYCQLEHAPDTSPPPVISATLPENPLVSSFKVAQ
ncbi:MAG: energy-coupling factor ABC transporter ATP-binding protein [Phormidesmis sp.]